MKLNIKYLRNRTGLSQVKFAALLGVSVASLRRWEAGYAKPSQMVQRNITEINALSEQELIERCSQIEIPKVDLSDDLYKTTFLFGEKLYDAVWMPYVINGPEDQREFYNTLIKLQQNADCSLSPEEYFSRISMLRSVDGIETAHYKMEKPRNNAKSWSSDYGTHGFHRYVGRFPSPIIRALINAFGAKEGDVILDPFCGSGTTLVEARMLGINAKGVEISPLSAMMSRVKSQFPLEDIPILDVVNEYVDFYTKTWNSFISDSSIDDCSYEDIIGRPGNTIAYFSNIERWFTKQALLGTSITVEYIGLKKGYLKDFLTIALSSKMRSIGNVDVDVVRAEYRKTPRENVDVLKLVKNQALKMVSAISNTKSACRDTIKEAHGIEVIEGSVLQTSFPEKSISHIITSPPYGVESLSYLRTHLLSFRSLESILDVDPYNFGEGIIGSEYLDGDILDTASFKVKLCSRTYVVYFNELLDKAKKDIRKKRITMMMKFFDDICSVVEKFSTWIADNGMVAFIIGNKKIGESIIPTDKIIVEIFQHYGFELRNSIQHKLKTNNSNSQVPWQDRVIENEFILIFKKVTE